MMAILLQLKKSRMPFEENHWNFVDAKAELSEQWLLFNEVVFDSYNAILNVAPVRLELVLGITSRTSHQLASTHQDPGGRRLKVFRSTSLVAIQLLLRAVKFLF